MPPEPVSNVNLEEWRQYQQESAKTQQEQSSITRHTHLQALKEQQRMERKRILPTLAKHGLHILNIARHFLKIKQREERQQARQAMRPAPISRKPHFETWLRDCGLHVQADRWRQQMQPRRPVFPAPRPTDTTAAYFTHFENILKHLTVEDFSRLDAMIALRLRANGHNPQAVAETILQCAPTIREKNEGRDWHR